MIQLETNSMIISEEEFQKYNNDVGNAFIALQTKMKALLKNANCGNLKNACITQMQNPNAVELSQKLNEEISSAKNSDELFDLLVRSPYWSWYDTRIMEAMVTASENVQARELLKNYKTVVFSKRVVDLLPNVPSKKVKEEYYAKVITKIEKDSNEITVADLLIFQSQLEGVIMGIKKGICILDHLKDGCVEIHWYIPTNCVNEAYQTARAKFCQFNEFHLQYITIGHYPVIQNLLPGFDGKLVSSPSDNVGMYIHSFMYVYTIANYKKYVYSYILV